MKTLFISIFLCLFSAVNCIADGIGTWKNYMSYSDVTDIHKGGNNLYVLASSNLYTYNLNDESITTYDKTNGLSDCNIDFVAWCNQTKSLAIIYNNQNIDVLSENGNITNIADYYNKTMTQDKTINSIYVQQKYVYLCTKFGIIKVNLADYEITATYNLGLDITRMLVDKTYIYAETAAGEVYNADMRQNLLDKNNWNKVEGFDRSRFDKDMTIMNEYLPVVKKLLPGGPKSNHFASLQNFDNKLYSTGGLFYTGRVEKMYPGIVQMKDRNDNWAKFQDQLDTITNIMYWDVNCVKVCPYDTTIVYAGGKSGLYKFKNGKYAANYNDHNSPLNTAYDRGNKLPQNYCLVHGMTFDKDGNLWILNSQTKDASLLMMDKEGNFTKFNKPEFFDEGYSLEAMKDIMFDSRELIWFVNSNWKKPSLICYDPVNKGAMRYSNFVNQDGKSYEVYSVNCLGEDKEGNMWIGTNQGPFVFHKEYIGKDIAPFFQVKVPRNDGTNYADYLLSGIDISCMKIDGAGRKWFGTYGNGVYLISANNMTEIHHFTTDNSSILSNTVLAVETDDTTGEVYFATDEGLCSYKSDAGKPSEEMNKDNVYAYPNPVEPDYTGLITITGLTFDADVKITSADGYIVAQGRSNGGFFTWDGCNEKGKRVASGIYYVVTATSDGSKGTVCKIAVIN